MQIQALAALEKGAKLQPYTYEAESPKGHRCIIKVLACGICHSDLHIIDDDWGMSNYPIVPGHEVIGEVVEVGEQVTHLQVGDRVGVGWQATACMQCKDCLRGNENLCSDHQPLIVSEYGGFSDYLNVDSRFAFPIPDGIKTEVAGPLLCAGITVYSGLRYGGMTSGQEIGIIGVGGLGHLAVKFASRLGNRVTVFTTSQDKADFAKQLGAVDTILVGRGESPPPADRFFNVLLNTVPVGIDWEAYAEYLDADGTLSLVGIPQEKISLSMFSMLMKRRRILASLIGGRAMMQEMLSVAEKYQIEPIVETFPFQKANEAIERVRNNQVRYRAVLTKE